MTPPAITAGDIAQALGGTVTRTLGDLQRPVSHVRPASDCRPEALTYLKVGANIAAWAGGLAGATVICSDEHVAELKGPELTLLVVENPRLAFVQALSRRLAPPHPASGVHERAVIAGSASVDPLASIGPGCVIGENCAVGPRSVLHPNVVLYANVRIGADVTVHAGTVIGADGYGYERDADGSFEKFPHLGGVLIEDNVEIGSNTSIDRGSLGDTIIRTGARIDNQCHISHNVEVGRHVAVIAQSMIGGSAKIGDYAWLAPGSLIMNQAKIGEHATIGLGAVVPKEAAAGETYMGSPAMPAADFRRLREVLKRLMAE